MKNICIRFSIKLNIDINKLYFLYNGDKLNEGLKLIDIKKNNNINNINILASDKEEIIPKENIISSKEIICPICKENIFINFNNYKINLIKCKNNHNINNIYIKDFQTTQKINISKVICEVCKENNKSETYKNEFYRCLYCGINLCPLCKSNHDKNHNIINYENRNYICDSHNKNYDNYCKDCNKNICMNCLKEHKNHNSIYYGDILPNENIKEEINEFQNYIKELKNNIQNIINNLNNIIENFDIYYNIINDVINNYNNSNRNYETLINIDEFIKYKNKIMNDIKDIINDNNINNKFNKIMKIYDKINLNYIIGEIEIKEEDINREIRIINSFEGWEIEGKIKEGIEEFINEKEIKENIEIKINNEIIPFCYYYKFKEKGKYIIQYSFKNNLIKADCLFADCKLLKYIDLSNFNSKNINNIISMFYGCINIKEINLSNFNTKNVTDMRFMFKGCESLKNINLSNFNTENVINMNGLFYGCKLLNEINLSNFNTKNVTNMNALFSECKSLKKNLIYLPMIKKC